MATTKTPAELAEIKQKRAADAEAKRAALASVIAFAQSISGSAPTNVQAALTLLTAKRTRSTKNGVHAITQFFDTVFASSLSVSEDAIWSEFKLGRAEMHRKMLKALKAPKDPAQFRWVRFDAKTENYVLDGTGATAPTGWTGFVPVVTDTKTANTQAPVKEYL